LPETAAVTKAPQKDEGLRCLQCEYNLTGLTSDRCPECGIEVDWDKARAVRDQEVSRPGTWWDRWPIYLKPLGFVLTTWQVAFTPWIFARQLPLRPRLGWALSFGAICLISYVVIATLESDFLILKTYLPSSLAYILLQTCLFGMFVRPKHVKHPFHYWLVVSCYTSYPIMVVCMAEAPVAILLDEATVWPFSGSGGLFSADIRSTLICYLWWADLVCIAAMRSSTPIRHAIFVAIAVVLMTIAVTYLGFFLVE